MIYPSADKLDAMESKYALVIVAAKRARQIKDGARHMTDSRSGNPLTVALEEIAEGAIIILQVGEPEPLPTSIAATPVLGGLVATMDDDEHEPTAAEISSLLATPEELAEFDDDDDEEAMREEPDGLHEGLAVSPDASPFLTESVEDDNEDADEESEETVEVE